jgi:hypothetical protein
MATISHNTRTLLIGLIVIGLVLLLLGIITQGAGIAMLGLFLAALGGFVWLKMVQRARAKAWRAENG